MSGRRQTFFLVGAGCPSLPVSLVSVARVYGPVGRDRFGNVVPPVPLHVCLPLIPASITQLAQNDNNLLGVIR